MAEAWRSLESSRDGKAQPRARMPEYAMSSSHRRRVLQETDAEKQRKAEQGEPQVITAQDGTQLLEQRARPGSSSAQVAATGEVR